VAQVNGIKEKKIRKRKILMAWEGKKKKGEKLSVYKNEEMKNEKRGKK